ncbi:MAG: hypothetical protein AB7G44_08950 [Bacteroidia bacterium]
MQPEIYFRYLSGKNPDARSLELYRVAITHHQIEFSKKENRLHSLSQRFPFLIPFIDGGLALTQPLSLYRKNIYIILCILETRPEFFPLLSSSYSQKTANGFFTTFLHGTRAVLTGLFGVIIVKLT